MTARMTHTTIPPKYRELSGSGEWMVWGRSRLWRMGRWIDMKDDQVSGWVRLRGGGMSNGGIARAYLVHSTHALSTLLYVNLAPQAPHSMPVDPSLHWSSSVSHLE